MAWRKGHGNGAGKPRIETSPPDELPDPVAAPVAESSAPLVFREDGQIANKETARSLGAKGGLAKARKRAALKGLGLSRLTEQDDFHPYWKLAEEWIEAKLQDLATQCGGYVGPGPAAMVVDAGQLHFAGLYIRELAFKIGGPGAAKLLIDSGNLADKSRIQAMTAYEMAVREAKSRAEAAKTGNPYAVLLEAAAEDEDD